MATPTTKIVLKETTKMTLHERFSIYRQNSQAGMNTNNTRQNILMNQQASAKNQRLAVQMANRPSVVAALKLKKKSLKQRLGGGFNNQRFQSNIKNRLALGVRPRYNGNTQGRFFNMGGNIGLVQPGTSPMIKSRLGLNQNPQMLFAGTRGAIPQQFQRRNFRKGTGRNRNPRKQQLVQQQLSNNRGILFSNRINKSSFRAKQQRGRGRGGKFRNQGRDFKAPTKQDLDNDLDQYMSQVKSNLDAELDSYMSQAGSSMV